MQRFQTFARSRRLMAGAITGLAFAVVVALRASGLLEGLELGAYDAFVRARPELPVRQDAIALIRIHEEDIRRFDHPLPDPVLDRLLATVLAGGPRAVGVDLYRDAPVPPAGSDAAGNAQVPPAYASLGRTVVGDDRVVMIQKLPAEGTNGTPPPRWLTTSDQVGFSDMPVDGGGIVRRALLYAWEGGSAHLSLALQLALRFLADEGITVVPDESDPRNTVRLGATAIPPLDASEGPYHRQDDSGYQYLLDYRESPDSIPSLSISDAIADPAALGDFVRDKVVLIGTTAASVKDRFYTPRTRRTREGQAMFGIELHALAVSQLLRFAHEESRPLRALPGFVETAWILLWCLAGAALGLWNRSTILNVLLGAAGLIVLIGSCYALFVADWWIPVVPPTVAALLCTGLVDTTVAVLERRERSEVKRLFSRFLRPSVADEIWRSREAFMRSDSFGRPEPRWVTLTTLISDLGGYTALAGQVEPHVFAEWLNDFTRRLATVVDEHGGIVDDYAGDGIKANFGFPVARTTPREIDADARNAVACALAMTEEMARLNAEWGARGMPPVRMRIGISTGPAVVGVLGGDWAMKFTTFGDSVNLASRLETFDKEAFSAESTEGHWRILINEEANRRIGDRFVTADLGHHEVKGVDQKVAIFRVYAHREDATELDEERTT